MHIQIQPFFFQIAVKSVEAQGDGKGVIIEGFASTPSVDRYRDIVQPSAFKDALGLFMKNPALLRSHDPDCPAGTILSAVVTDKGLQIRGEVTEERTKEDVVAGRMCALSIGYIPLESTLQHEDGTPFNAELDSVWDPKLIRVITKLDLVEISIVTTPANGEALFSVAKSVQKYFNQVVTKSFMKIKTTEQGEQPSEAQENKPVEAPVETPVETPIEKTEEEVKPAEATATGTETVEGEEPKPKEEELEKPVESTSNATEESTTKPAEESEEAENAGEKPAPDSAEAVKSEEANAEAKPNTEAGDGEDKFVVVKVKKSIAEELTDLKEIGVIVEDENGEELSKDVVSLLKDLSRGLQAENKRANELQDKLDKIPTKQALAVIGQFGTEETGDEKKEPSQWFKKLFNIN